MRSSPYSSRTDLSHFPPHTALEPLTCPTLQLPDYTVSSWKTNLLICVPPGPSREKSSINTCKRKGGRNGGRKGGGEGGREVGGERKMTQGNNIRNDKHPHLLSSYSVQTLHFILFTSSNQGQYPPQLPPPHPVTGLSGPPAPSFTSAMANICPDWSVTTSHVFKPYSTHSCLE